MAKRPRIGYDFGDRSFNLWRQITLFVASNHVVVCAKPKPKRSGATSQQQQQAVALLFCWPLLGRPFLSLISVSMWPSVGLHVA